MNNNSYSPSLKFNSINDLKNKVEKIQSNTT